MSKIASMQDTFLNQVRKDKVSVVMYLTNGFQLKGTVKGFDNFVVLLEVEGKMQMIYKHAISTVIPTREIVLAATNE